MFARSFSPVTIMPAARFLSSRKKAFDEQPTLAETQKIIVGGPAAQASVLDRVQKDPTRAKKTTVVSAISWVRNIHEDWFDREWGQPTRYLPEVTRKIASTLFPHYPDDKLMTFGMMRKILETQKDALVQSGVRLIEEEVDRIEQTKDGLVARWNGEQTILVPDQNFRILHAASVPVGPEGMRVNHFGKAYSVAKEADPEPIIIVGAGLSLPWALRDLTNTPIIHVIPPGDRRRPDLEKLLHASIRLEEAEIQTMGDGTIIITGKNELDGKWIEMRVQESSVFSAMGSRLSPDLIHADQDKISYLDLASSSPRIQTFFGLSNEARKTKPTGLGNTVVPDGSYLVNFLKINQKLGAYEPAETNAVLLITAWENAVMQKLKTVDITINPAFFSTIEDRINHIFEESVPTEKHVWVMIKNAYNKRVLHEISGEQQHMATNKEGEPVSWEKFKQIIMQPTEEIVSTAHVAEKKPAFKEGEEVGQFKMS